MMEAWFCPELEKRPYPPEQVRRQGTRLGVAEINQENVDKCFCGTCGVPVFRWPVVGFRAPDGTAAHMKHRGGYRVPCERRATQASETDYSRGAVPAPSNSVGEDTVLVFEQLSERASLGGGIDSINQVPDREVRRIAPRVTTGSARTRVTARMSIQALANHLPRYLDNPVPTGGVVRDRIRSVENAGAWAESRERLLWWGELFRMKPGATYYWFNLGEAYPTSAAFWVRLDMMPKVPDDWCRKGAVILAFTTLRQIGSPSEPRWRGDIDEREHIALVPAEHAPLLKRLGVR